MSFQNRSYTSRDFLEIAAPRRQFLIEQRDKLQEHTQEFDADIARLGKLHQRTRNELASYLLAEVSDPELGALEERLSYPGLLDIKRGFEEQLAKSEAERQELEATPEIQHHEFHVSRVNDEMAALREPCQAYRAQRDGWTENQWFAELDARSFFSHDYEPSFFNRFWDWRAVSFLMDEVEDTLDIDLPTPEKVREAWRLFTAEADPVLEAFDDLKRELSELTSLKERHEALLRAPDEIFRDMVGELSRAVLDHLDSCHSSIKSRMARNDNYLVTFFKKESGLSKQLQYLKELKTVRINPLLQSLNLEIDKLQRKIWKARRKYKTYNADSIKKMHNFKEDKWRKRHSKLHKVRDRVSNFKKYQQGDFSSDYLWWDVMTRGAPGDDLYEVRSFRRSNPQWNWRTYEDPWDDGPAFSSHSSHNEGAMDTAAMALADGMHPRDDDDWSMDVS